jgi:hypothetical protein
MCIRLPFPPFDESPEPRRSLKSCSRQITLSERVLTRIIARLDYWRDVIGEREWRKAGRAPNPVEGVAYRR